MNIIFKVEIKGEFEMITIKNPEKYTVRIVYKTIK
mgnify:CR=1 FL=1